MPETLGRADVVHVARLARLELSGAEIDALTVQLGAILSHAASIAALDLSGVAPTSHPVPLENVLRPDEARPSLARADVLAMAPAAEDGRFRVPRILGET